VTGGAQFYAGLDSDWKKWSRAERCFAIALVILSLVIPLGVLVGGRIIGI
jgi:hypothetical protein